MPLPFIMPIRFGAAGAGGSASLAARLAPMATKAAATTFNINAGGDLNVALDLGTDRGYRVIGYFVSGGAQSSFAFRANGATGSNYIWSNQYQPGYSGYTLNTAGTAGDTIGKLVQFVGYEQFAFELCVQQAAQTDRAFWRSVVQAYNANTGPTFDMYRGSCLTLGLANLTGIQLCADAAGAWFVGLEKWNRT